MSFYILTYQKLDSLISQKSTGTPRELAHELQLNRNQLYGLLNDIRALGAYIYYDRKINSFCYENSVSLKTKVLLETSYIKDDDAETMIKVPNMFSSGSFSDS